MLNAPDLQRALAGLRFGQPTHFHPQIGSTNAEARRLAEAGAPEGTLVTAEEQTAGRGRLGRTWLTPPGGALALSLILRPRLPAALASRLSLLGGLAAAEAVEAGAGLPAALKWPNDVTVRGRKVGGLLLEAAFAGEQLDFAVLGLGLNVNWAPPPEAVDFPATSLQAESGQPVDRLNLLRIILLRLEARYAELEAPSLLAAWRARLATLGQRVSVRGPQGEWLGVAEEVDADGALWLRLDSGERRRVLAGDVRLRPEG